MGEKLKIVAQLLVATHLAENVIKRQRYKNVKLYFVKKASGITMLFNINKKENIIPLKKSTLYTRRLQSHGVCTISLQNPHKDYMITTTIESDNHALFQFLKRPFSKSERNYALNNSEIYEKINILARKLNVVPEVLIQKRVDLSKKSLTGLPKVFGDLKLVELNIGSNAFGSNMNYWTWAWGNIRFTLHTLSLVDNKLTKFPSGILSLYELKELDLSQNNLSEIPPSLFCPRRKLVKLSVKGNSNLQVLPRPRKPIWSLNIVDCPKLHEPAGLDPMKFSLFVPSLKCIAGKTVLQSRHRLSYTLVLPWTLITYLDDHFDCWDCGRCIPLPNTIYSDCHYPTPAIHTSANDVLINLRYSYCDFCYHAFC